jgi:hypothetical protein
LDIVVYNIVSKLEDNYFLPVPPIILSKAAIYIDNRRTQPIANYIKSTKSSKSKGNNIN